MFTVAYSGASPLNDTRWKNEEFDKLLVAARVEADEAKRRQMYYDLQQITSDDGGALVPIFANSVYAMTAKVQHDPASPATGSSTAGAASSAGGSPPEPGVECE